MEMFSESNWEQKIIDFLRGRLGSHCVFLLKDEADFLAILNIPLHLYQSSHLPLPCCIPGHVNTHG